ncbi:transglutaminase-like cysteine peptidase [Halomonas sp. DP1Y21-3]|uniref:transglutaminase-like cysteine peptidase n=1 Tax=Halomonas sp. DP1Y21-3 TaxID=2859080 RepID=UPI001C97DA45|nr:transglutaminase-like cysteine peptidase [Halomonas sp. DP1Y21-3]MBY6112777.1 transglutaminase-like cysteine peptidase [Halomonas sp. DP1Y21-3]
MSPDAVLSRPSRRRPPSWLAWGSASLLGAFLALAPAPVDATLDHARMRAAMSAEYGSQGVRALDEWLNLIDRLRGADLRTQLRDVNDFFNRKMQWLEDRTIWRQSDYWATPIEALGRGAGDCEDYSIAKYVTLKELGIPISKLRMIYVRARLGRSQITQAHMVLGYYETPGAEPLILDNIAAGISRASLRTDLDPLFSFNSSGLWAGGTTQSRADPLARLSRWRNALDRMRQQGIQ